MKNLLEEQLQKESDYYKIGKDFQKTKLRGNIKAGKRKLFHELDELDEIEELPSIFTTIPTDRSKKIRAARKVFDKVIKQVPSTDHFKKEMTEENEKTLTKKIYESKIYLKHCKMTQKVFFYSFGNLSKTIINKAKKSVYDKDKVFVNLYEKLEDKNFHNKETVPLVMPFVKKK